jgi:pimeloyl-ACP methyl ester carboxylesterase
MDVTSLEAVRSELMAVVASAVTTPLGGWLTRDSLDAEAVHSTPVVLVHGLFGSQANFWRLRGFLAARGVTRFSSFKYGPRLDYQRLASDLGTFVERVCEQSGVAEVDVVGHSLGGLIARELVEHGRGPVRIRRLVSLGSPWYGDELPARELALYAATDWLIPALDPRRARGGRVAVIEGCSHLSLLHAPSVLAHVAAYLSAPSRPLPLRSRVAAVPSSRRIRDAA